MILTMPLPQMLQATMMAMATMATHQFLEQLLMADEDRFRPMAMMIGPVTIGGKKRMTLLAPNALNRAARMTYIRPAHRTPKQA